MERFFRSVISTLSFLFIVAFCMSGHYEKQKSADKVVSEPMRKNVKFERVPAIVEGDIKDEKKFDWGTSTRH